VEGKEHNVAGDSRRYGRAMGINVKTEKNKIMTIRKNFTFNDKSEYHLTGKCTVKGRSNILTVSFGDLSKVFNAHSVNAYREISNFLEDNTSCYMAERVMGKIAKKVSLSKLNGI
jgi:hypothetical protein